MLIEELAERLESLGVGIVGRDVFYHSALDGVQEYTLLMYSGDGIPINWELPMYYDVKFQAIIRHPNHEGGFILANAVKEALTFYETTTTSYHIKQCLPREEPRPYKRGDAGILEFSINFSIAFTKL